jgi:alkanesulfonate monooxygenase SsuD/methylene tetrahydromethanopterin reductase-like flavin-dependent oxidoreductase (luciferase family)
MLDRLSGGRMILGVGLGAPIENEYARFGEPTDLKVLAGNARRGAGSDDVAVIG